MNRRNAFSSLLVAGVLSIGPAFAQEIYKSVQGSRSGNRSKNGRGGGHPLRGIGLAPPRSSSMRAERGWYPGFDPTDLRYSCCVVSP